MPSKNVTLQDRYSQITIRNPQRHEFDSTLCCKVAWCTALLYDESFGNGQAVTLRITAESTFCSPAARSLSFKGPKTVGLTFLYRLKTPVQSYSSKRWQIVRVKVPLARPTSVTMTAPPMSGNQNICIAFIGHSGLLNWLSGKTFNYAMLLRINIKIQTL